MARGGNNRIDLTGKRFERLLVIERAVVQSRKAYWRCLCDCGREVTIIGTTLRSGDSKSCGCIRSERLAQRNHKHGQAGQPYYTIWRDMMHRCYRPANKFYANYGGRGITVCDEWRDDPAAFIAWCRTQEPITASYSIDRINNEAGYSPSNCRFASAMTQRHNSRPRKKR